MKKKYIVSLLVICMVFSMFGVSACEEENSESSIVNSLESSVENSASSSEAGESSVEKTDEEIFAAVKAGMENTENYNGEFTYSSHSSWMFVEDGEEEIGKEEEMLSFDPTTNRAAHKKTEEDDSISTAKVFEKNGSFYYFDYDNRGGYSYLDYFEIEESDLNEYLDRVVSYNFDTPSELAKECNSFALAENYDVFTQAFATVAQSSLSQMEEGFEGSVVVSTKQENGMDCVYVTTQGQQPNGVLFNIVIGYAVKDGKLAEIYFDEFAEIEGNEIELKMTMEYNYLFDEEFYNSITADGFELETKPEESTYVSTKFVLQEGLIVSSHGARIEENSTAQSLFSEMAEEIEREYCYYHDETKVATIDGWYLDEECTQKLNVETLTMEGLLSIDKLYAKSYTVNNGYATYAYADRVEDKRTIPYQIVENLTAMFWGIRSDGMHSYGVGLAGDTLTLNQEYCKEILINGALVEEGSFVLQGGQVYVIERCYYSEDKDINVFEDMLQF